MTERQPTASFPVLPTAESTPLSLAATTGINTPNRSESEPPETLPRAFGRYELRRLLGRGGMGRVYLAHDPQLDRLVALKVPNPVAVEGWRERFVAEARAAATLTHPNVCPVYEVGEERGQPYLTMAYIEGETLATALDSAGSMQPGAAVALVCTVARAMQEAHRRGIVHRDLKPANLMIDPSGRPVIMDFGLAIRSTAADDLRLTLTGVALGTPSYMPPEQAGGDTDAIGPPADVYSLGVILYEMVTGRVPFKAKSFGKLLAQIERDPPPAPSSLNPAVDSALEAIILKCLAKRPIDRFDTAGDLADALSRYLEGDRNGLVSLYSKPYLVPDTTADFRPARPASTVEYRRPPRRGRLVAGAAALLLILFAAGAVIYVRTDYGDLQVKLSDPSAKVDVRVNGQTLTLTADGKVTHIKAGPGELVVSGDGFETAAKSFTLKRGETTLVEVTLVPKPRPGPPDPKQKPDDPNAGKKPSDPQPPEVATAPMPREKLKPVPFPEKATLIEVAGWQILTDANKDEMQKWLDERKKDKHSVMWLDVSEVNGKPCFSAVAALDNRAEGWLAYLEVPPKDKSALPKGVNLTGLRIVSFAAHGTDQEFRGSFLFHPPRNRWLVGGDDTLVEIRESLTASLADGMVPRGIRPCPFGPDGVRYCHHVEMKPKSPYAYGLDLYSSELTTFLETEQKKGLRPCSLSACARQGTLRFAVVMESNSEKWEWLTQSGLTATELKARTTEQAEKGFRPSCVTAYPWDGAVRYCVVWVKEPPKPVPYPKEPKLIEVAGWQIYTDANKDDMQKWLDERKKDRHSVLYLSVTAVEQQPVYCAVAALDERQPGWTAILDIDSNDFGNKKIDEQIDLGKNTCLALSGHVNKGQCRMTFLFAPGKGKWAMLPDFGEEDARDAIVKHTKSGLAVRGLHPYPSGPDALLYAINMSIPASAKNAGHEWKLTTKELANHFDRLKRDGARPVTVAVYESKGELVHTVTAEDNRERHEWQVETGLSAAQLKAKTAELAKTGFRPSSATAYPFDGAVRYCVVWVKEPPKKEKEPEKP
jgi:hypothetical protein